MFLYDNGGPTSGPEVIGAAEFYQRLIESFTHAIRSRQEGVFQIDLRLRPYGRAGSLAVSLDAFAAYFGPEGAAWPYERQALVKLALSRGTWRSGKKSSPCETSSFTRANHSTSPPCGRCARSSFGSS